HRLRRFRLVNDDAHEKRFLPRNRLKSHDVYTLVRQFSAEFSKRSGAILHANGQFLNNGHVRGTSFFAVVETRHAFGAIAWHRGSMGLWLNLTSSPGLMQGTAGEASADQLQAKVALPGVPSRAASCQQIGCILHP